MDGLRQGVAVKQFHGDEGMATDGVDVVNRADVRMIERGGSLRLTFETLQRGDVAGEVFGKKLKRHMTVQSEVFSLIHHTHPAAAQMADNSVMRNGLADHGGRETGSPTH